MSSGSNDELIHAITETLKNLYVNVETLDGAHPLQVETNADLVAIYGTLQAIQAHYIDALRPRYWACQECGCTDLQETAWIYMNTGENTGEDGPLDDPFCPQCGCSCDAERTATELQPFDPDRDEFCVPDDQDGDHTSALASAGFGTDEDYSPGEDAGFFGEGF